MSNIAIKHLGKRLLKYKYNLHLFELLEDVYYFRGNKLTSLNLKKLAQGAKNVITCEYNRAHITKTWFQLKQTPAVIVNRPFDNDFKKNMEILHSDEAKILFESIKDKIVVLYQGIVDKERPIEIIARAIEKMSNEFVFVVMTGNDTGELKKYSRTYCIPFISPPYHLEVTSHAHIGVLLYTPVYGTFSSPLNSIYCAPNKLYEYSQFGIPMLGNDIPGLRYTIDSANMGLCINDLKEEEIQDALVKIYDNYDKFSSNSLNFYNRDNNLSVIKRILEESESSVV